MLFFGNAFEKRSGGNADKTGGKAGANCSISPFCDIATALAPGLRYGSIEPVLTGKTLFT